MIARNDGSIGRVLIDGAGADPRTTFIQVFMPNPGKQRAWAKRFRVFGAPIRRFGVGRWLALALLALLVALRSWDPLPVAIVDLDEVSLAEIGQWPWPRTQVADLVARIAGYGSVAIGVDSVFAEPDRMSPTVLADPLRGVSDGTRDELRALPSNDRVFADALSRARVVLGQSGYQRDLAKGRSRPISQVPIGTIVAYPLISSFAVYIFLVFVNYFHEESERRQVRGAFSQSPSPALVEQLARNPEKLVLRGEIREMGFLFCDGRGCTMISELFKDDPQGLTRLMNRFSRPSPTPSSITGARSTNTWVARFWRFGTRRSTMRGTPSTAARPRWSCWIISPD